MTESILALGIFAVPMIVGAVIEQRKSRKRELALLREMELMEQFKHGMAYRDECFKQSVLNAERMQVDKEEKRFAN